MNTGPFTPEELMVKAADLARKYRGYGQKEDLAQEAILAYYEGLAVGCEDEGLLITRMRKAMYFYATLKDRPVKLPKSGKHYRLTKELSPEEYEKLSPTEKEIYTSLRANSRDLLECDQFFTSSEVATVDFVAMKKVYEEQLTEEERAITIGCLINGVTQKEMSEMLGCSQQRVNQMIKTTIEKFREGV